MAGNMGLHRTKKPPLSRNEETRLPGAYGLGIRHVQTAVMAVAIFVVFCTRASLNVAIVAMIGYNATDDTSPTSETKYDWDEKTQRIVLSSYLMGYVLIQIPAGVLTERLGAHELLCFVTVVPSVLTVLLPGCAYVGGWILVAVNKMLQGLCQGFCYPAIYALLGVWAPPTERSTLTGIALGGGGIGTVVGTLLSGFISAKYGWPSVFYAIGTLGTIVGFLMVFLGDGSPATHKLISKTEKLYIESSLGGPKMQREIPWKRIVTSVPVFTTVFTMMCRNMVLLVFNAKLPTYIGTVLKFDLEDNGAFSACPHLTAWLLTFFFSWLSDFATNNGCLQLSAARKVFNSIGFFGSAIFLLLLPYTKNRTLAVFLLSGILGTQAATFPGVQVNLVDIAPNFSGVIFSLTTFLSCFLGIFGVVGVRYVVTESGSVDEWRNAFYLSAAILIVSNLVFIKLGTAKTESWNWPEKDNVQSSKQPLMRSQLLRSNKLPSYRSI